MEELLTNNIFFGYLLGILVIINYEVFEKKQKIAIIYACSFGLTFNKNLSCRTILALLLFILFLYEEYLSEDLVKIKYVKSIKYKLEDFVYMYVIHYKLLYVVSAIILKSSVFWSIFSYYFNRNVAIAGALKNVLLAISILLLIIGVHRMFNNPVELKNFRQINQKFNDYPYYLLPLKEEKKREILLEKLELVADIEDYTFFVRKNSYCSFSIEFIRTVAKKKIEKKGHLKSKNSCFFYKIWRRATCYFTARNLLVVIKKKHKLKIIKEFARHLYKRICIELIQKIEQIEKNLLRVIKKKHKLKIIKEFARHLYKRICIELIQKIERIKKIVRRCIRGYSTIEMQLIRILAYKKGLKMGKPQSIEDAYLIFTRKIYEIVYAPMFFSGLKKYLMISKEKDFYRYYLVYIYLHTVQTTLNGRTFAPLDKIFCNVDVIDWPKEALFIIVLGLNNLKITKKRVDIYKHIIEKYHLNQEMIYQLVECIE